MEDAPALRSVLNEVGFRVQGFRVYGFGLRVRVLGFRV